ncbi:hypothetical protein CRM22_007034 [Opisthorchis felineus]|uniref:CS domain-containing protein n=1 Tax=Opisthorchis felineus TaxID=147828 RepID=A0A4S2LQN8_OPIFE|nr:hypothetical protein CRM22_007034 [Opisthorchis felineus]
MRAPRHGCSGLFTPGCSGPFHVTDASGDTGRVTEVLTNGSLEATLTPRTLSARCTLDNPNKTYLREFKEFPSDVVPAQSRFQIKNGQLIVRLRKAPGSKSWVGVLKTTGLR